MRAGKSLLFTLTGYGRLYYTNTRSNVSLASTIMIEFTREEVAPSILLVRPVDIWKGSTFEKTGQLVHHKEEVT